MVRDPAMLVWLDGGQNRLDAPNENFAREILELFTMGVGSGYTEKDIQEAARSFTGWVYDGKHFYLQPFSHDDGWKTFLGQSGNFHGDDIVDIIVRQPASRKIPGEETMEVLRLRKSASRRNRETVGKFI